MMPKTARRNITLKEAMCGCKCGAIASPELLDLAQELRDDVGFSLPFSSIVRCLVHNKKIGGSSSSVHLLSAEPGPYGGLDIVLKRKSGKLDAAKVYRIFMVAIRLGFNNFEVCNAHVHVGKVPFNHPQFEKIYWGRSK